MAVAEKTTVERVVMTDGFTLKLTVEEAETLVAVLARVGGVPDTSPRGKTAAIQEALRGAGVRTWTLPDHPAELLSGGLTFSDYGTAV